MKMIWMPQALCQNYTMGESYGEKCPYCPYSYDKASDRLIFDNKLSVLNLPVDHHRVTQFFLANRECIERTVMITGGEPLLYPYLTDVLWGAKLHWHITTNTLDARMIDHLDKWKFRGCKGWTASYHPLAGKNDLFARNIAIAKRHCRTVNITIVMSHKTKDIFAEALAFARSLGPRKVQVHLDAHNDAEELRSLAASFGVNVYAGKPKQGVVCRKNAALMALGPDGTLFECVTKMYQNFDPVANIGDGEIDLSQLPDRNEFCGLECFAVCDHIKHAKIDA